MTMNSAADENWEDSVEAALDQLRAEIDELKARLEGYKQLQREVLKQGGRLNELWKERKGPKR
jgi:hypothetical protein